MWGAIHGFYLVFAIITEKLRQNINHTLGITKIPWLYNLLQVLVTFVLAYIAWIFFRANNVSEAFYILKNHFVFGGDQAVNLFNNPADFFLSFVFIAALLVFDFLEERFGLSTRLKALPRYQKWVLLILFVGTILMFAVWNETDFLYFQF